MSSCDPESSDPQNIEDMMDINEDANNYAQHLSKPSISVASSVYELLECPVCLNAMYPPIHQDMLGKRKQMRYYKTELANRKSLKTSKRKGEKSRKE